VSKRWMQYKVCFLDHENKEQTLFSTINYMDASEFATKSDLEVEEVYIKSVWKTNLPPPKPVERINIEEKK
jgi:hypothetical protein